MSVVVVRTFPPYVLTPLRRTRKYYVPLSFDQSRFSCALLLAYTNPDLKSTGDTRTFFSDLNEQEIYETNICLSDIYSTFHSSTFSSN